MSEEKTLEKLDFNKLEAKDGELKITHVKQTLETPKVYYDKSVQLQGTISAPGNFIQKRKERHAELLANVQYSYANGYIKLQTEENQEINYSIEGRLIKNPDIANLKINSGSKLSVSDLTNHLRMKRFFFADTDQHKSLLNNLQSFKVEAQKTIEAVNDNRGNEKALYEIRNTSNINLDFDVLLPVFIGQPKKKFKVEILYTVREKSLDLWMESPEIEEAFKSDAQTIIDFELKRFPETFVFIEQS